MKQSVITFLILLTFAACEVVELDSPSAGENGEGSEQISNIGVQADDSMRAVLIIADTSSRTWAAKDFTLGGSSGNMTACRLDDEMIFFRNGNYSYNAGELCGAEDNRSNRVGSWRINYQSSQLIFDENKSNEVIAEIIGLTENELRLKGSYFNLEVRGLYTAN